MRGDFVVSGTASDDTALEKVEVSLFSGTDKNKTAPKVTQLAELDREKRCLVCHNF